MAKGIRAKLLRAMAARKRRPQRKPHCVIGKTRSGAQCSKGTRKEVVTSVGS